MRFFPWAIGLILAGLGPLKQSQGNTSSLPEEAIPTFVNALFPEPPSSFDPIDAQLHQNYLMMAACYARPLELDKLNRYRSSVLESFVYLDQTQTIKFYLKRNNFFSDGSPLTLDDLAFSIARTAYFFPDLKHLSPITGLREWLKLPHPLLHYPQGFTLDRQSNCLSIHYDVSLTNPFFFFLMYINGIIPKNSVDARTGKLKIPVPPFSGAYSLAQMNPDGYLLQRRSELSEISLPEKIQVKLVDPMHVGSFLKTAHQNLVMRVDKEALTAEDRELLNRKFRKPSIAENLVDGALFNPRKGRIFSDQRMRQFFAEEMRKSVLELNVKPAGSLFTIIHPGYLPLDQLRTELKDFEASEREVLILRLQQNPPRIGVLTRQSFFQRVLEKTLSRLKIKVNMSLKSSRAQLVEAFRQSLDIINGSIGLQGLEPTDAPRIFITAGLSPSFGFLREDPVLLKALSRVYQPDPFTVDWKGAQSLNRLLFRDASFSVFRNHGHEDYVRKDSELHFPTQTLLQDLFLFFSEVKK